MHLRDYTEEELTKVATPIIETMITGTNTKNYPAFSAHFSPQMKDLITPKKFIEQVDRNEPQFGQLSEFTILGYVKRPFGVSVIYKQKTAKNDNELLRQLFLNNDNGEIKVLDACIN